MASAKRGTAAKPAAKPAERDSFLAGGEERGNAARWTQGDNTEGSAILGKLAGTRPIKFADGKEGAALIFAPCVERTSGGEIIVHRVCETIFSAVLGMKITPETDRGAVFAIRYDGKERSEHKGRADFKRFTVVSQTPATLAKQLSEEGHAELAALVRDAE